MQKIIRTPGRVGSVVAVAAQFDAHKTIIPNLGQRGDNPQSLRMPDRTEQSEQLGLVQPASPDICQCDLTGEMLRPKADSVALGSADSLYPLRMFRASPTVDPLLDGGAML